MRVEMCIHNYIYYRLSDEDEKRNSSVIHDVFPQCHDSESGVKLFYLYFFFVFFCSIISTTIIHSPNFEMKICVLTCFTLLEFNLSRINYTQYAENEQEVDGKPKTMLPSLCNTFLLYGCVLFNLVLILLQSEFFEFFF